MTTNPQPAGKTPSKKNLKKGQKLKKQKKPMPRFMIAVWSFLVFLLLLAGAGYCLWANVGGVAEKAMVLLPQYKASLTDLDKRKAGLDTREAKLVADTEKLASAVKANDGKLADLQRREEKLAEDKKAFEDGQKAAKTAKERRQAMVAVYESMDADAAAAMLLKAPTLQEAADILVALSTEKQITILTEIQKSDADKAYRLSKLIGQ